MDPSDGWKIKLACLVPVDEELQLYTTGVIAITHSAILLSTYLSTAIATQRCILAFEAFDFNAGDTTTSIIWLACELVGANKWDVHYKGKTIRITPDETDYNNQFDGSLAELL
jgi:hypothetical protein